MQRTNLFRLLYLLWALPCLVISIGLATATRGHPPGFVFIPVVLAVWGLGHALLVGIHALARRGEGSGGGIGRWPIAILVATVGSGLASFLGLLFAGNMLLQGKTWHSWDLLLLGGLAAHLPALVGLLLRRPWARVWSGFVALGWAALMLFQIVETLWRGGQISASEWAIAAAVVAAFTLLAWRLLRGDTEAAYFASPGVRTGH